MTNLLKGLMLYYINKSLFICLILKSSIHDFVSYSLFFVCMFKGLSRRIIYYICIVFSAAMMTVTPTEQRMMISLTDAAKIQGS